MQLHNSGFRMGGRGENCGSRRSYVYRKEYIIADEFSKASNGYAKWWTSKRAQLSSSLAAKETAQPCAEKSKSIIWSDWWRAYNGLEGLPEFNLGHGIVNHSEHFIDPVTKVHTRTIEGSWSWSSPGVKGKISKHGWIQRYHNSSGRIHVEKNA